MTPLLETERLFHEEAGLDQKDIATALHQGLDKSDDGELFLEYRQSEALSWEDGVLKNASFDSTQGFGLRAVLGDRAAYAHASSLDADSLMRAAATVQAISAGYEGSREINPAPIKTNRMLYTADNPLENPGFEKKVKLLGEIDSYLRASDPRVRQASISLAGSWQAVRIVRPDGEVYADIRPLVRLNVSVLVEKDGRMERGSYGAGGRFLFERLIEPEKWQGMADEALRQALVNLNSIDAPAGEMPVILGPGWPGVLLHEAVGHGLEGDFNRKQTSVFTGRLGEQVASKGVTIVDDGTMPDLRGSLSIDDEGTPSQRTTLIEDGKLVGYMQDRQNAALMGMPATGNGRRQSFAHIPMPRMTNTFMLAGKHSPEEILSEVKRGLYAVNFGGGQVDIVSGKFTFSCTEAYLVENGKIGPAVKGATLIGNGLQAMNKVAMIGNDLKLDDGIGTCGKSGQGVPVGVGQPSLLMSSLTVGGTAV